MGDVGTPAPRRGRLILQPERDEIPRQANFGPGGRDDARRVLPWLDGPGEDSFYLANHRSQVALHLVLPKTKGGPAYFSHRRVLSTVPLDVFAELVRPEREIRPGRPIVNGATMPEAAIDEDSDPLPSEYDVCLHAHDRIVDSVPMPAMPERLPQDQLGRGISPADLGHVFGSRQRQASDLACRRFPKNPR